MGSYSTEWNACEKTLNSEFFQTIGYSKRDHATFFWRERSECLTAQLSKPDLDRLQNKGLRAPSLGGGCVSPINVPYLDNIKAIVSQYIKDFFFIMNNLPRIKLNDFYYPESVECIYRPIPTTNVCYNQKLFNTKLKSSYLS